MLIVTVVVLILLYVFIKKGWKKIDYDYFPEPPSNFFLGHIAHINSTTEILNWCSKNIKEYGNPSEKTIRVKLGPSFAIIREGIITTDYKFIEFLLTSNQILTKSENYNYLKSWLKNGLLISNGHYWRRHRKILTPTFHFEILKDFVEVFESVGNKLIENLSKYDGGASFDVHPLVTLCTLDIICESAMGTKINAQNGENTPYVKSVKEMCHIIINRCLNPLKIFNATFWLTKDYYKEKKALKILHGFTSEVINSKRGAHTPKKNNKRMAFLDLLLKFAKDEGTLTDTEIQEEVDTFMFEGHDTTASSICFTLYCLADNPEVQKKLLEEQKELFAGEKNPSITFTDLQNMKYLDLVIKESLRLYPPVPVLGRYITADVQYKNRTIPKNTNIAIIVWGLHRDENNFPEPEKFNPDRFSTFDGSLPYIYIPFSAGPRNCIGQKFAMLEIKSIISKIVRHFEILPANPKHKLILSVEAVLKSVNGIKVGLRRRD